MKICIQPGCGYVFPKGQKIHEKCPNCEKSPFTLKPNATYTKEELQGRKILLSNQKPILIGRGH